MEEMRGQAKRFGPYELIKSIAVGGMSEVFLGRPLEADSEAPPVVIKRILPLLARDERFLELFQEETRISKQMDHANVVRVLDAGTVDGQPFIVMEYVDGVDCWRMAQRCAGHGRPIPSRLAVYIVTEALRGLAHVHDARSPSGAPMQVVHGDLSPTNIYTSRLGEVKLGDFGIARARHQDLAAPKIQLKGKVAYMAPEQVDGVDYDQRADLFSAGTVLTELLIHHRLFAGRSQLTTLLAVRDCRLGALERNRKRLPDGMEAVLRKALARAPERRFATAAAMCEALEPFLEGCAAVDLATDLAELVELALEIPAPSPSQIKKALATPLARKNDGEPSPAPRSLLHVGDDERDVRREAGFDDDAEGSEELPPTPIDTLAEYTFHLSGDRTLGPMAYAAAVEKVIAEEVHSTDRVSIDGGEFTKLSEVTELSRHAAALTPTTVQVDAVGPPDRRGLLHREALSRVFLSLALARETGVVIFDCASIRKEVYLEDGDPQYVSSNVAGELLGEFLVRKNVLTRMELDMALAMLPKFQGHLGETLIGLNLVEPVALFRHITDQVRERLLDLFTWERGEYLLYRGVKRPHAGFPLGLEALSIIWHGVCRAYGVDEALEWVTAHRRWIARPAADQAVDPAKLRVPPRAHRFLERIQGPVAIEQAAESAGIRLDSDHIAARALILAVELGIIEVDEPEAI